MKYKPFEVFSKNGPLFHGGLGVGAIARTTKYPRM